MPWTHVIDRELQSTGGAATRAQLLRSVPGTVIDGQIGRGQLQRVFPHVCARRGPAVSGPVLLRAALLHAGETSALGVLSVFTHRSVPPSIGQFVVSVEGRRRKLDRAWPEVCLAVELDGARFHTDPEARQRDLARDAALASIGWLVLRFTYADVLRDPDGVRARVLAVYAMRAAQLS
jgi:hypothetical protein